MKTLTFATSIENQKFIEGKTISFRDYIEFMEDFVRACDCGRLQGIESAHIFNTSYKEESKNELMCKVVIYFQAWKNQKASRWTWTSNRAKDFSCSNRSFELVLEETPLI